MPTYQYACTNPTCGERFELVQSFTDPAASECPTCAGPVRKVFSAVGVVFKGSGFYRTDSRAGNGKPASGSSGSSSSEAGESSTTSTATKESKDSSTSSSSSGSGETKSTSTSSGSGSGSGSASKVAASA